MRLIDADALRDALGITGIADSCKGCKYNDRFEFACNTDAAPTFEYVCEMIDDAPTIEERKGKWERHYSRPNVYADLCWHCSNCGYKTPDNWANKWKFCPNCGARMVQEGEDNGQTD